jgi:hypothetical protein
VRRFDVEVAGLPMQRQIPMVAGAELHQTAFWLITEHLDAV